MLQAGQQASLRSGRGQKSICLTISAKSSSTMVLLLADVSMKGQPQSSASAWPSLGDTSLSSSRSTLLPTRTTGTCWYLQIKRESDISGIALPSPPRWVSFGTDYRNFLIPTGRRKRGKEPQMWLLLCVWVCVCIVGLHTVFAQCWNNKGLETMHNSARGEE